MTSSILRATAVAVLAVGVANLGLVGTARAGIVDTGVMLQADRVAGLDRIHAQLDRGDVRSEMQKMGVSQEMVDKRLATLSDSEIHALAGRMDSAPSGGSALVLVGAVFVVLMILEFTGVIDIFKRAPAR